MMYLFEKIYSITPINMILLAVRQSTILAFKGYIAYHIYSYISTLSINPDSSSSNSTHSNSQEKSNFIANLEINHATDKNYNSNIHSPLVYNYIFYIGLLTTSSAIIEKLLANQASLNKEAIKGLALIPLTITISALAQNALGLLSLHSKGELSPQDPRLEQEGGLFFKTIQAVTTNDNTSGIILKVIDTTAKSFMACASYILVKPHIHGLYDQMYTMVLGLGLAAPLARDGAEKFAQCNLSISCFIFDKIDFEYEHLALDMVKYSIRTLASYPISSFSPKLAITASSLLSSLITANLKSYNHDKTSQAISLDKCKYVLGFTLDSLVFSVNVGTGFIANALYATVYGNSKLAFTNDVINNICSVFYKNLERAQELQIQATLISDQTSIDQIKFNQLYDQDIHHPQLDQLEELIVEIPKPNLEQGSSND